MKATTGLPSEATCAKQAVESSPDGEPPEHPGTADLLPGSAVSGGRRFVLRDVPRLVLSGNRAALTEAGTHPFRYRAKTHGSLPHVVKFSAGRSSGMLLFTLLESGLLDAARGDVIVFNNTSAEHPYTYKFARECAEVSQQYGVPFFWIEFQTYEDARSGEWTRLPAYRLVNGRPRSDENPDGFQWRGEVFEELLSWTGYVPNQFSRICTRHLKLEATRLFLKDWLASKNGIPRLGHYGASSRVDDDTMYRRHLRKRGGVPKDIFLEKRAYGRARPHFRPAQRFADFCQNWRAFENPSLAGRALGDKAVFGKGGVEYVAMVGLRGDEQIRVKRVEQRNMAHGPSGYEGEHVYMPLATMSTTREDVNTFWDRQDWDLALPAQGGLSNCVYCFLKGVQNLRAVHDRMSSEKETEVEGFGPLQDTPCDLAWWNRVEHLYGRDLEAEQRNIQEGSGVQRIGFFGGSRFSYDLLANGGKSEINEFSNTILPCDCTE